MLLHKDVVLYIDSDACPVKEDAVRAACRHGIAVVLVGNQWIRSLEGTHIRQVVVPVEPDAADHWIAAEIGNGDICITNDIPLAARCVEAGATALSPSGRILDAASAGMALAVRDLMTNLRDSGEITGGPRPYSSRDRQAFLNALERLLVRSKT